MEYQQRVIEDVGMANLQFPIRVMSGRNAEGQDTVASITVNARILQEFEARWIDRFIQVLHRHRGVVGCKRAPGSSPRLYARPQCPLGKRGI